MLDKRTVFLECQVARNLKAKHYACGNQELIPCLSYRIINQIERLHKGGGILRGREKLITGGGGADEDNEYWRYWSGRVVVISSFCRFSKHVSIWDEMDVQKYTVYTVSCTLWSNLNLEIHFIYKLERCKYKCIL